MLFGILASLAATVVGLLLIPTLLQLMGTPEEVLPYSLEYFRVYFGGVSTIILYNMCMAIMQALGDSIRPLFYLLSPGWTGTNRQRSFEDHKRRPPRRRQIAQKKDSGFVRISKV